MSTILLAEKLAAIDTALSANRSRTRWLVLTGAIAFLAAYFEVFLFPATPVAPWGDPVLFLENAKRILAGHLPYRDYLQFTTPGTELLYAALIRIWHGRAWIPNLAMVVLAALTASLITYIATRFSSGFGLLVPTLLFTGFVLPNSLYATHHWFSTVAVLAAACVLVEKTSTRRIGIAGLLCGLAGFFTQTKMVTALLALTFLLLAENKQRNSLREFRARLAAFWLSAGAFFILANLYFIRAAGLGRFVFCTIVFPIRYYPAETYNTWRVYGVVFGLHSGYARGAGILFVYMLIPFMYLTWFLYRRKHPPIDQASRRVELLVALIGLGMFLAIAGAPSPLRLCTVSPPALILFARVLNEKPGRYLLHATTGLASVLILAIPITARTHWHAVLETPSGRLVFFNPDRFEEFRLVLGQTTAGQAFFGHPPLSFDLGFRNPTPVNYSTTSDFTRPSEVREIVKGLEESRPPLLVLMPGEYGAASSGNGSDHMQPFREYLTAHYRLERRFATGDEAWVAEEAKVR